MKQNLFFEDKRSRAFGSLVLGIFGITITVGALFVGGQIFGQWQHQRRLSENDEQLAERLAKLGQYYDMVHQLGDGNSDIMRQQFSLAMANEISEIRSTLGATSKSQQDFAEHICSLIARDQVNHPRYYQVGNNTAAQQNTSESPVLQQITQGATTIAGGTQNN